MGSQQLSSSSTTETRVDLIKHVLDSTTLCLEFLPYQEFCASLGSLCRLGSFMRYYAYLNEVAVK